MRIEESEHRLQGTRDNIQDQEEELAQLQKMYKADDVTEETEEIVLKRAERQLARSKKSFGYQTTRAKRAIEVDLPREEENLVLDLRKETNDLDRLKATSEIALRLARLELEKARMNVGRQEENLAKLERDREAMVVKAPAAGWAVPGACVRGKWSGPDDAARALEPGRSVKAEQVLWTIVVPGAVGVRSSVGETQVLDVQAGQEATVQPAAVRGANWAAKVRGAARVTSDDKFEVLLDLASPSPNPEDRLMPGWTCRVKVRTADKPDAVTVPSGCVVADPEKADRKLVHVFADGKAAPREVEVGATSGGRTEIVKGLEAGERVLKSPPKAQ